MTNDDSKALTTTENRAESHLPAEKTIILSQNQVLDLSHLTESQIQELKMQHASGIIDIQKKAAELNVDVGALDLALGSFTDQTAKATEAGAHTTITHTQTSSVGRTEVVIGNTDKAASGKISRSAAGGNDIKLWVVGILAITAIIIAVVLVNR